MEKQTTEQKFAGQITDGVNNTLFNHEEFNKAMSKEHKTLQQNFTRMCLKWIEHLAQVDPRFSDARNEASLTVSKRLIKAFDESLIEDLKGFKPSQHLPNI
jgi:hypothetical protein